MIYQNRIEEDLVGLKKNHLYREILAIQTKNHQNYYQSKKIIDFASNDYLSLTASKYSQKLKKKLANKIKNTTTGGRSSPLVFASSDAQQKLIQKLKKKLGKESVLLFSSAYSANVGTIAALSNLQSLKHSDEKILIFQDKLNHASLLDGGLLAKAELIRYAHLDYQHLTNRLDAHCANNNLCLIVSDAVFSMDGDKADLEQLIAIKKKYQALLMIDDAHGMLMNHGLSKADLREIDIYSASFAKALGSNGALIATNQAIGDFLINKARSFIYSTAINPLIAEISYQNLKWIEKNPQLNQQLDANISYFKASAQRAGIDLLDSNTPIQAVLIRDNQKCLEIQKFLLSKGFAIGAIRSPTVPKNTERLRISIHSNQKKSEIKKLTQLIAEAI